MLQIFLFYYNIGLIVKNTILALYWYKKKYDTKSFIRIFNYKYTVF